VDFELAEPSRVVLDVLDVHGRRVRRIADGWFTAGRHSSMWRGDDDRGHALGSGVYFVRMQGIGFLATRRIVRIR
jgi:flagellar hook assembly protein FlgD